jgi:hypothetical protein
MNSDTDFKRREKVIPHIVYNVDTDFSKITNVLLVDNSVSNYNKFVENCNESTFSITFSQSTDKQEIVDLLASKLPSISRISIVADNSAFSGGKKLLNFKPYFLESDLAKTQSSYSSNVQFLIDLIKTHGVKHIDYLACNSLKYEGWKGYYSVLAKETGVIVGASSDKTGNIQYGGDWVMESTGVDVEAIYFTSGISGYQDTLDTTIAFSGTLSQDPGNLAFTFTPNTGPSFQITDWPIVVGDGVTITFGTDLIFNSEFNYFSITSNNVTINGDNHTVTMTDVAGDFPVIITYAGLVYSRSDSTIVSNIGVLVLNIDNGVELGEGGGWIGSGNITDPNGFIGTIRNCYSTEKITRGGGGIVGFGCGSGGTCTITDCYSTGDSDGSITYNCGGIAGDNAGAYGGTCIISNCHSTGTITFGGGIVGFSAGASGTCKITNCYSNGNILNTSGGIAGEGAGNNIDSFCEITNCYSTGNIRDNGGGIVGLDTGSNSGSCYISDCHSSGAIGSVGSLKIGAGGIVGSIGFSGGSCTITNCYSTGTISNGGGIAGYGAGANSGDFTITDCYSTGTISDNSGGIAGSFAGGTSFYQTYSGVCNIRNCYSTGDISGQSGGIVGQIAGTGISTFNVKSVCNITNSYSTGTISDNSGGIAGPSAGDNSGTCNITNCYSTGAISGQSGGIVGQSAGSDSGVCDITNCYSTGSISGTSGGIAGINSGNDGVCNISRCYVSGTVTNDSDVYSLSQEVTINSCTFSNGWFDEEASINDNTGGLENPNSNSEWKLIYINKPWKLLSFLSTATSIYNNGTLIYTSLLPISAYPNALTAKLLNGVDTYGSVTLTLTQRVVEFSGVTGINNGLSTYLVLYNGDSVVKYNGADLVDYANSFIIGTVPTTTTTLPICFRRGTMILTPRGYKPVEGFKTGDMVKTVQGRNVPITKVHYFIGKREKCPLYVLHKDSLDYNVPLMDLYMSEGHAYSHKGRWTHMKCSSIAMKIDTDNIEYYNIAVENYMQHTLIANGVEVESLFDIDELKMTWNCKKDDCKPVITMK